MIQGKAPAKLLPRILWRVLPAAVVVLCVTWIGASTVTQKAVRVEVEERQNQAAKHSARTAGLQFRKILQAAEGLAANHLLINSLADSVEREAYLDIFFQSLRIPGPEGAQITLTDYRGRSIAANGPARSYKDVPWMETVMKGKNVFQAGRQGLVIAVPVLFQNRAEGAIVVEYGAGAISEIMAAAGTSDITLLLNESGSVIYSSDPRWVKLGVARLVAEDVGWIHVQTPVAGFPQFSVIEAVTQEKAFAAVEDVRRIMFAAIVLSLAALIGGIYLAVYLATKPLTLFISSLGQVGGDLDYRVTPSGSAEFHSLAETFNDMLDRLEKTVTSRDHLVEEVSERKRAERALATAAHDLKRSNEELERFASIAAHDLQEPLRKVQAFGDRLKHKCADILPEDGQKCVDVMQGSAQRMQMLIDALLDYSRVGTKSRVFTTVDMNEVAREVITDLEETISSAGAKIEIGALPTIDADPMQMRQLLQNLIGNGLKFRREGVQHVVTIAANSPGRLGGDPTDRTVGIGQCEIVVKDNGIGFESQHSQSIFDVFTRLHGRSEYAGSGIGLSICRRIVERHYGRISAIGCPGESAEFRISLPVQQAKQEITYEAA